MSANIGGKKMIKIKMKDENKKIFRIFPPAIPRNVKRAVLPSFLSLAPCTLRDYEWQSCYKRCFLR